MARLASEVSALRKLIERTAADGTATRALSDLRSDLAALVAECDARLNSGELAQQAGAIGRRLDLAAARRRAVIREELLAEERFTEADLDGMGIWSVDQLDAMEADGSLEAALASAPSIPVGA